MDVRLYVMPGSHPSHTARLTLKHKGIGYKRVDLIPGPARRAALRVLGFPRPTVPAMKVDGRRIQGTRDIARELDRIQPEPPLFPADEERRADVELAEAWGDEVFQELPRRMIWNALGRNTDPLEGFAEGRTSASRPASRCSVPARWSTWHNGA